MKVNKLMLFLILVSFVAFVGGCTIAKISGRGSIPLMMNQPQAKTQVMQNIQTSKQILFDYTGSFDVSEVLSQSLIGPNADAIINLTITLKTTPLDFLLNLVTLGLAQARTFEISGQLIKAPQGLGSLSPSDNSVLAESSNINDLLQMMDQDIQGDASSSMILRVDGGDQVSYRLVRYNLESEIQ